MNRYSGRSLGKFGGKSGRWLSGCSRPAVSAAMLFALSACGEGPGMPGPPQGPPRPVTSEAYITTAHFEVTVRPSIPRPGAM